MTNKLSMTDRLKARAAAAAPVSNNRELEIPLEKIRFDPRQPRKAFHAADGAVKQKDLDHINELAESIKALGLIEAITVQELADGSYLVVVGECRTRAHLKLGRTTIRAVVINHLAGDSQRLLYQVAENVNREDLSDEELALVIRELLKGSSTTAPMLQSEIARTLGKSEGWVSRFVKFGDLELQRLWVKSGIVDTVENLYRVSILPPSIQMNVQRRCNLDADDPEFLAKPLLRAVIDALSRDAKILKASKVDLVSSDTLALPANPIVSTSPETTGTQVLPLAKVAPDLSPDTGDALGALMAASVVESAPRSISPAVASGGESPPATGKYKLPEGAREKLLSQAGAELVASPGSNTGSVVPSLKCSLSIGQVEKLVALCSESNDEISAKLKGVRVDLAFPGNLAQALANRLTGIIVAESEVTAVLQGHLGKL